MKRKRELCHEKESLVNNTDATQILKKQKNNGAENHEDAFDLEKKAHPTLAVPSNKPNEEQRFTKKRKMSSKTQFEVEDHTGEEMSREGQQPNEKVPLTVTVPPGSIFSNRTSCFQAALLNFIATCPIASDGVINVSYNQFEFQLLQELSEETLHDYDDDCSFLAKINFKASYLNLPEVKRMKKTKIRDLIQSNFRNAFTDLLKIVDDFDGSSSSSSSSSSSLRFPKESIFSIITSVTSKIILTEKRFNEGAEKKFDEFFTKLERKIRKILNRENIKKKKTKARRCAAWIEYRMMFADQFLSETLIQCNAASLLLSSFVLLLAECDFPIFLSQSDYFPKFSIKGSEDDVNIINTEYENLYLKKFKENQNFQPIHFPRALTTDTPEELWSYYRSVILDNMLLLLDSSSSSNVEFFTSNGNSLIHAIRKNASHYKSMIDAIQLIEDDKTQPKAFAKNLKNIIENVIAPIHGFEGPKVNLRQTKTKFQSTPPDQLSFHYEEFYKYLAERIINYKKYDIIETLARIDYDVSVRHHFFQDGNARTAQAIVLLLCAYFKMAVPEIVEGDRKQRFLSRLSVVAVDLNDDAVFQFWYKYYTTLFELPDNEKTYRKYSVQDNSISYEGHTIRLIQSNRLNGSVIEYDVDKDTSKRFPLEPDYKRLFTDHVRIISENVEDLTKIPRFYVKLLVEFAIEKGHMKLSGEKSFDDGWSVFWEDVIEKDATIYKHGMRLTYEMTLLKKATGFDMKQLVVFKPERMVFHKFIVYLITHYQISAPALLSLKSLYVKVKSIQDFIKESDSKFESVRKEYEVYLDQCYFDDPLELNREPTLHAFIEKVRGVIRGRITDGKCQISPSQSRKIMRMLVVDELLREYFEQKAEHVVANCFERIQFHPSSEDELEVARQLALFSQLQIRNNDFERVAWVVVGGPAAGKSTLKRELKIQSPVCEINPDDYKLLLYDEGGPQNASLVHEESSFIADQIMKALKTMSKRPDILLDVVKSSEDRMDILAEGGTTLHLTIATCEAEEAINRAYDRATKSESSEDLGRFVPTKEILLGHKKESLILPAVIRKYRINLDLFDTSNLGKPVLIAQLETKRKELKIYRLSLFLKFIRKALINEYATHSKQVYLDPFDGKAIYKELMKYINEGVTLSFINEGTLYAKIDPFTGLTSRENWCERFLKELEEGEFNYSDLEDLLLYFVYPHYCNGLLVELPEKQKDLLDIELFECMVRNKTSNNELSANEAFREFFPKLCASYPTKKLIKPTPLEERKVQGSDMINMIRGKDTNIAEVLSEEGRAQLVAEALLRLEAKKYELLMESLKRMRNTRNSDDIQKIIDKALLSFRIFPLAKRLLSDTDLASYVSVWIPETVRSIFAPEHVFEMTNAHQNTFSLTLKDDISGAPYAVIGKEESHGCTNFWSLKLIDDESFHIFGKDRHDKLIYLKLGFKQKDRDRDVKGGIFDEDDKERFQWQLIPREGGKSFLIMNTARQAYMRLRKDLSSHNERIAEASQGIRNQNDVFAWQLKLPETQKKETKASESSQKKESSLLELFLDSSLSENQAFFSDLVSRFPELKWYGTLCDATPDVAGHITTPNESLVNAVFGQEQVQEWINQDKRKGDAKIAAINRSLLRLLYLRSLMRNDRRYFPLIAPERLNYISKNLVLPCCQDEKTFELLVLSTIWDALGRTKTIQDVIDRLKIQPAFGHQFKYGHDEYWRSFINFFVGQTQKSIFDELIPSFQNLSPENQKLYRSHVATNAFNLGAFVQGECVPYCLYELLKDVEDCSIRLLVLLISFFPIQYNDKFEAVGLTNALYDQYTTALTVIAEAKTRKGDDPHLRSQSTLAYKKYLKLNAQMVGVPVEIPGASDEEILTLHRIVALSRSRFPIHWRKVWFVWKCLAQDIKDSLTHYMTITGFDEGHVSIYIYYAPAIISNTMKAAQKLEQFSVEQVIEHMFEKDAWTVGLYHGLVKLAVIYRKVHNDELPKLTEKKPYYIYYGKEDADRASEMVEFCTDPLTAPPK